MAGENARSRWDAHVDKDVPAEATQKCVDSLELLRVRVRELTSGWGGRLKGARTAGVQPYLGEYIPDQQGCYEVSRRQGGTLACGERDYSGQPSMVRRGVAKQKGKYRVVTMQSAETKRVLSPVHNAIYDHISSFGWCVRGDVQREDFASVVDDRREGESFISGDYTQATDNIYLPAVKAVIDVLAESTELSEAERKMMLGSFTNLRWRSMNSGREHTIKRGSMMGNLISFPLLCLLNKASYDIACDIHFGEGARRIGRFNGDDCCFCGDRRFYDLWREITSNFGFIVNEEKTGFGCRYLELNSSIFDSQRRSLIAKPVLSFLRPSRNVPGTILPAVIEGIKSFSKSVQQWIVCGLMQYEITLRGVLPGLSSLGPWWRSVLVRQTWFRKACLCDAVPTREVGTKRTLAQMPGPPPSLSFAFSDISRAVGALQRDHVSKWLGVRVVPYEETILRTGILKWKKQNKRRRFAARLRNLFVWGGFRWVYTWPTELLEFVEGHMPSWLDREAENREWMDDHPLLTRVPVVREVLRVDFDPMRSRRFAPPVLDETDSWQVV